MREIGWLAPIAAILFLTACDGGSPHGSAGPADPLPEPSVDWQPVADDLVVHDRCEPLARILLAVALSGDRDAGRYRDSLDTLPSCQSGIDRDLQLTTYALDVLETANTTAANERRRRARDRRSLPLARLDLEAAFHSSIVLLPETLETDEQTWLVRCERPMDIGIALPYQVRQALADALDDNSYLISEWETRLDECEGLGASLHQAYLDLAEQEPRSSDRELLELTAARFQENLDSIR